MATKATNRAKGDGGPSDQLRDSVQNLLQTVGNRAVSSLTDRVSSTTGRLSAYASGGGGGGGLMSAVTGAKKLAEGKSPMRAALSAGLSGITGKLKKKAGELVENVKKAFGGGKGGKKLKVTNIIEQIDVGAPRRLTYDQWTRFTDFPSFMKKVENVEQESDEKLSWKAQVFWSHRIWESTIVEQVPDERIVWRSKGAKGHVDGGVSFHALAPDITRILLVLEYHPQGLFERTGNLWRAQGRRARLELKHFRRHVMTQTVLHPDEIEGWRGEIHDGEVVQEHEPEPASSEEAPSDQEEPTSEEEEATSEQEEAPPDQEEDEEERARTRSRGEGSARAEREPEEEPEEGRARVPAQRRAAVRRSRAGAGGRSDKRRES